MAYNPPVFNLFADAWTCDGAQRPADGPADIEDIPCQKYVASRAAWPVTPPWTAGYFLSWHPPVQLRFPRVSPFDLEWPLWKVSCVEVPQGSGQYYRPVWGDVQHQGFPNEYALLVGVQVTGELLSVPPPLSGVYFGIGQDACGNVIPATPPAEDIPPGPGQPPPPPEPFFQDSFVDQPGTNLKDHVSDTGQPWINGFGLSNIIASGVGVKADASNSGPVQHAAFYTGPADGTSNLICVLPSSLGTNVQWGLTVRSLGPTSWVGLIVAWDGVSAYRLYWVKSVSGSTSVLGSASAGFSLSASTQYELIVIQAGDQLDGQINTTGGILQAATTVNDSFQQDVGNIGLQNYVSGSNPPVTFTSLTKIH